MCVCVILISFHALGKALLALRCLSSFRNKMTSWPLWNELFGLFAKVEQIHFTAFDLWVNNLQIKKGEGEVISGCTCSVAYKERRTQSERGDWQGRRLGETNSDDTTDLSATSHWGRPCLSCLCGTYCSGGVTYALLYIPLYFKRSVPLHSAQHTAATVMFRGFIMRRVSESATGPENELYVHTNCKQIDENLPPDQTLDHIWGSEFQYSCLWDLNYIK